MELSRLSARPISVALLHLLHEARKRYPDLQVREALQMLLGKMGSGDGIVGHVGSPLNFRNHSNSESENSQLQRDVAFYSHIAGPRCAGFAMLPADKSGTPGEAAAHRLQQNQMARLNSPVGHRMGQRQGDGGGRGIRVLVDGDDDLLGGQM